MHYVTTPIGAHTVLSREFKVKLEMDHTDTKKVQVPS